MESRTDTDGAGMCGESTPSPSAFWDNLRQPMPVRRKLRLLARNQWLKISRRESCCGHPGEPGC